TSESGKPKSVLIVTQGPDGHPWNTHEFRAGARILKRILDEHPGVVVRIVDADESPEELNGAIDATDGVVLLVSQGAKWVAHPAGRRAALERLAERGGGITALHWAVGARE